MKRIGIIGTRRRDSAQDFELCEKIFLDVYVDGDELVSGGCSRGGDRFCELIASKYNIPIKIHLAEWDKYGKRAGFIRNTYIAEDANIIIALLPTDGSHSNGTEDTIKKAEKMGKNIILAPQIEQSKPEEFDPFSI